MKKHVKFLVASAAAVALAAVLILGFAQARKASADQDEEGQKEQEVKKPSLVSTENGQTILTVDSEAQSRIALVVVPLKATFARQQVTAPAVVLQVQDLVGMRGTYLAAQAKLEKAQIAAEVSRKEHERLKALYQANQGASQKALESAEGAMRSDQADILATKRDLELQGAAMRQSWGEALGKWVSAGSSELTRVLDQSEFLVAVTLPPGEAAGAPQKILLEAPGGELIEASKISPFPRVDPRIQGISYLYAVPARPGMAPDVNLVAHLPIGPQMRGVVVPRSSIVWWQGKAWIYQQTAADRFARREVPTETPVTNGFFVAKGYSPGDKVVTLGTQMLLSEEYRSVGQGGREIE